MSPVLDDPVHPEHGEVEAGEDEEGGDAGGGQGVQGLVHYQEPGQEGHSEDDLRAIKHGKIISQNNYIFKTIFFG